MSLRAPLLALAVASLIAGCSGKPPAPQAESAKAERVATPWDGMKKSEQRARDVQKTVDQQAAEQRKAIEQAEQ